MGYSGRFPQGKPSVTGSRYPAYGTAGCLSVSILHRTLTWTTESSTCAKTFNACDRTQGCADTERESALKVDSGQKKSLAALEKWKLRQRRAGPTLYELSYTPSPVVWKEG